MNEFQRLVEFTFNDIKQKQQDITTLFPTFKDRVRKVASHGGVRWDKEASLPDTWKFTVTSGTDAGIEYENMVRFKNIPEMLKKFVPDRSLWKKDGSGVNLRLLASQVLNNVDMEVSCSCPATLYWGQDYIRTQKKAQYGDQEDRPPDIRNPDEHGALCKHGALVFEVLRAYTPDFANHLDTFYSKSIELLQKQGGVEVAKPGEVEKPEGEEEGKPMPAPRGKGEKEPKAKKGEKPTPPKAPQPAAKPKKTPTAVTKGAASATEPAQKSGAEPMKSATKKIVPKGGGK